MHVPFFDIGLTHAAIAAELDAAWRQVLDGRQFILVSASPLSKPTSPPIARPVMASALPTVSMR